MTPKTEAGQNLIFEVPRDMTSLELVEAFEREAGLPWFREEEGVGRIVRVSGRYPRIFPTWPRLIRERAEAEAVTAALERLRAVVEGLPTAGRHPTAIKGAVLRAIDEEADR